ncbi:MAG: NERD domain-containing protein, partial [Kiritimatiellaeota bacterium]|nr:NERD domain-containing protein [Kiritimatiellota bacterium]
MNETQVKIYGVPGERARTAGTLRVVLPLMAAVLSVGVVAGAGLVLLLPKLPLAVFGGMLLLAAVFLLWTAQMCPGRVTSFFKGARGEERAAFALEGLPEGFCVFHGFARRGLASIWRTDVDHVVLGKTGVFVVETKCWDGEVTC